MFGNGKLKAEIVRLSEENKSLRKRQVDYEAIDAGRHTALIEAINVRKEIEELKKKVRVQNEADLMFISLKIVSDILKGNITETKECCQDKQRSLYSTYHPMGQAAGGLDDLYRILGL